MFDTFFAIVPGAGSFTTFQENPTGVESSEFYTVYEIVMGKRVVFFLALACLLFPSCQKKEKGALPCCIYDQPVFEESAMAAAGNGALFAVFRRNPFFNLLWENSSCEEGEFWAQKIRGNYPHLLEKLEQIKESDSIGSPRMYSYGSMGEASPTTLRFAALCGELKERCGETKRLNIIQIGAGYGGLCKMMHALSGFETYTLVDLPGQLALAKRYLDAFGVENVIYQTPQEPSGQVGYDLVISEMAFSEFNCAYQELFFDKILSRSHFGFLQGHLFPKHYGVEALNFEALEHLFAKKGKFSRWEVEEPSIGKENYFIFWEKTSLKRS